VLEQLWKVCADVAVGARAAAVEAAWIGVHLATYPLGLLREEPSPGHPYSIDRLPPIQRGLLIGDIEAAGTPILLVHGIVDNRTVFGPLRSSLHRRGFGRVLSFSYGPLPSDLREPAAQLRKALEDVCEETGHDKIHLVGHSLGGLIARHCVQRLGGHERVHTLVTLGTPHAGTLAARMLPLPLLRQLRPGSTLLNELAAPAPGVSTRFVAFWSDLDEVIHPQRNARLEHPDLRFRNVPVHGVGHLTLPIDGRVARELARMLAQLDSADTADVTFRSPRTDNTLVTSSYSEADFSSDLSDLA
jgi:pimeloyl-ACP methyl ester carboxylesterase